MDMCAGMPASLNGEHSPCPRNYRPAKRMLGFTAFSSQDITQGLIYNLCVYTLMYAENYTLL